MPSIRSATWGPTKRNRKLGTESRGYKKRNRFGIPRSRQDARAHWEKLEQPVRIACAIGAHQFAIFVEPTRPSYRHHVTVDDILSMLKGIPENDKIGIVSIVLRQPKKKESIFSLVWGRLVYWADYDRIKGPAIILDAQQVDQRIKLGRHLSLVDILEFDSLRSEGHIVSRRGSAYNICSDAVATRNTQLYRTLLHEIGHYVDFMEKVLSPADAGEAEYGTLLDLYHARPWREKEHFAARYASRMASKLRERSMIPFEPANLQCQGFDGLKPEWFSFEMARQDLPVSDAAETAPDADFGS